MLIATKRTKNYGKFYNHSLRLLRENLAKLLYMLSAIPYYNSRLGQELSLRILYSKCCRLRHYIMQHFCLYWLLERSHLSCRLPCISILDYLVGGVTRKLGG